MVFGLLSKQGPFSGKNVVPCCTLEQWTHIYNGVIVILASCLTLGHRKTLKFLLLWRVALHLHLSRYALTAGVKLNSNIK